MSLVNLHKGAAILHLGEAIASAVLVDQYKDKPEWDNGDKQWPLKVFDDTYRYQVGYMIPVFSGLSSINHLLCGFNVMGYNDYVMRNKANPLRWMEYALSASVMLWIIATISGVQDINLLISIVLMNMCMQFLGAVVEYETSKRVKYSVTLIAWGLFVGLWAPIISQFVYAVDNIESETFDEIKPILYSIISTLTILFSSFGFVQLLYVGEWIGFETYEKGFIILSFVAKSLLTWLTVGGIIAR
jgi:hypothetical protein